MKTLLGIICATLFLSLSCLAVAWDLVTVTVIVKEGGGSLTTTTLHNSNYLNFVSNTTNTPKSDLFVGIREDNGQMAVVRISDETPLFTIVTAPSVGGFAANGSNTKSYISGGADISDLNTAYSGAILDAIKRSDNGEIKSIHRSFTGGSGNQVVKGSAQTTGRKVNL